MVWTPNVNDDAPESLQVERRLKGVHMGRDSALIKTDAKDKTAGGVYLPAAIADRTNTGVVVQIGEGGYDDHGKHIPPIAKVGDHILFGQLMRCYKIQLDLGDGRKDYHLIDQDEILCILEYEDADEGAPLQEIVDVGTGV